MANLGRIKDFVKAKGMTIDGLAEAVGLSQQGLRLLIRTNSTKVETLEKIASVLGVPPAAFFDNSEEVNLTVDGNVSIPSSAWLVIQRQAESLSAKDKQVNDLIDILRDSLSEIKKTAAQKVEDATSAVAG